PSKESQLIYSNSLSFLQEKIEKSEGRVIISLAQLDQFTKSRDDVLVENEDALHIPLKSQTVQVVGGVQQPTSVVFVHGKSPAHYINQCGSYTEFAIPSRTFLLKADGSILRNASNVSPGDTIYVAEQIKIPVNWLKIITDVSVLIFNSVSSAKIVGIIN
ncbi:MAG: polysaccharide export outer membrane protein, partial [Candidatus Marinamargulisbacteria bacterium]